jgi:hypothetical protein
MAIARAPGDRSQDRKRDPDLACDPLDEPSFLPVGVFTASEGEQDVVGVERPHMVVDGRHGGVVAYCPSDDASAARVELAENRVKALIGLMARPVGVGHQPLDPGWKRRRDDEDLVGRLYDPRYLFGQLLQVGRRCAGQDQQSMDV